MKREKKRSYSSGTREMQAAQTRANILEAAKELFKTKGFDQVTIHELAQEADVSMPTIYAIFKSKRGVLQALIDNALPADQFNSIVDEFKKEKSPKKRLSLTAKIARQIYEAEKGLLDILRSASIVSSELKELEKERERRRYDRLEDTIKMMIKDQSLSKELTLETARDILWALTGRDMYRMLVIERGWTSDQYEKWLTQLLSNSLLQH